MCLEVPLSHHLIKSTVNTNPEISLTFCSPSKLGSHIKKGKNLLSFSPFKFKSSSGRKYTTEKLGYKIMGVPKRIQRVTF